MHGNKESEMKIMKLIINEIELIVNNAYTERDTTSGTLSAVIEVAYDTIGFMDLKTLFMNNSGTITKINDDESEESWDGFVYSTPPVDTGEQYKIVLIGEETTYQIERTRHLEKTLIQKEASIIDLKSQLQSKCDELAELAEQCADMLYKSALEKINSTTSEEIETTTDEEV